MLMIDATHQIDLCTVMVIFTMVAGECSGTCVTTLVLHLTRCNVDAAPTWPDVDATPTWPDVDAAPTWPDVDAAPTWPDVDAAPTCSNTHSF